MQVENKLQLQAKIDRRSGFCFGVVRAVKKAEALLDEGKRVYSVGQIVHNEEEVQRLSKKGLITISHEDLHQLKGENILFRAHGEPPETYERVKRYNNILMDATCPIVLKLQRDVRKAWQEGQEIFIFGKKGHPEVKSLVGQTDGQARVFDSLKRLQEMYIPFNLTLFSQTTMNPDTYEQAAEYLQSHGARVDVRNTICSQVSGREEELRDFSRHHDRIVFIAGRYSSNGRMLYEICRSNNPRSHFISGSDELDRSWFSPGERIGVCGATSTPQWLLEEVRQKIESF